ncbi:outer membrane beta-barrel protein [Belliella kenyensis]|uniref:Outer membrane beta-barrel protein n=1 Tax=Belliella kenyensis TaxID=1472724 RepID=A0ABV8EN52_9BACT|nr:outer membrane beta-barrel protein [Belliella kenyensis]MCH7402965.1 TonB-dependent receptor [Belliella kenyensis]MDN3605001.1 TonB-dependent receptor [Belliella kenyensis]
MKHYFTTFALTFMLATTYLSAQQVTISGTVKEAKNKTTLPYVNVLVNALPDSTFVSGTVTDEKGLFKLAPIKPGRYLISFSYMGYKPESESIEVGRLNNFLDLGSILLIENSEELGEVIVAANREEIATALDKKTFTLDENISQLGGSVLQALQNLPGITIDQSGTVFLRGSDKVAILLDGKQTAITGIGAQSGLENFPASSIEKIEIINNPSSKYDATGNAGIINIIFKKEKEAGWNGKAGMIAGVGNVLEKRESFPGLRDQYRFTPKLNPSLSLNYKKEKINFFFQGDVLWHKQMMKNEFTDRVFEDGTAISQQYIENRTQPIYNLRTGLDWNPNENNSFTFSGLFNYRAYTDLGDIRYQNAITEQQQRLWQYFENEINQTIFTTISHTYKFRQPGHKLTSSFNYSFRRKDEIFYFTNQEINFTGTDTTALIADENIFDLTLDYIKPLRSGRMEFGTKQRARVFPNLITFSPGENSILDPGLAGSATYQEWLSAVYGNYIYEKNKWELEAGLRLEYVKVDYLVDPNHAVFESAGFDYFEPFPSLRASYIINDLSNITIFYNRRVDRPEEKNLRAFPTYADPEILSIGNPTLVPQFTQSIEAGYKVSNDLGYFYTAIYHRASTNLLTRITTEIPNSSRLVTIDQNAGRGWNTGLELVLSQKLGDKFTLNTNANVYQNKIDAFTLSNAYPSNINFSRSTESNFTGNIKINGLLKLPKSLNIQLTAIYLAPDIVPQGRILARYHMDGGVTKKIQEGKGELFFNAADIFNTLVIRYRLEGNDFTLNSNDYFETQVFRLGYSYRF